MNETDLPDRDAPCEGKSDQNVEDKSDLVVEIRHYRTLLKILDNPKSVVKVGIALLVLVLAIFMALAFTTIAIKRFYPYNEIRTNAFGATTMQNEEVELTYWLFNTAELWADSGIRVEEGDVVTIRASGRSNTSIHHLVDNAFYNSEPRYQWVGTEGQPRPANTRTAFRIYPERDPDALILQVIPETVSSKFKDGKLPAEYRRPDLVDYDERQIDLWRQKGVYIEDTVRSQNMARQERFYYIGKERIDLKIAQSGTLHFAVNDIVLTRTCIDSMIRKNDRLIRAWTDDDTLDSLAGERLSGLIGDILQHRKECDSLKRYYRLLAGSRRYVADDPLCNKLKNALSKQGDTVRVERLFADAELKEKFMIAWGKDYCKSLKTISANLRDPELQRCCDRWRKGNSAALYFGPHPVPLESAIDDGNQLSPVQLDKSSLDSLQNTVYPFYNEMTYYRETDFYRAWYDDNVGSFLIVVEKRKK